MGDGALRRFSLAGGKSAIHLFSVAVEGPNLKPSPQGPVALTEGLGCLSHPPILSRNRDSRLGRKVLLQFLSPRGHYLVVDLDPLLGRPDHADAPVPLMPVHHNQTTDFRKFAYAANFIVRQIRFLPQR